MLFSSTGYIVLTVDLSQIDKSANFMKLWKWNAFFFSTGYIVLTVDL